MPQNAHTWPETEESLILRVKDPLDDAAWARFLAIYRPVVLRMARGRGLQDADAEDLAQLVFASIAKAISNWESGPDRPPFRAWLYRIARNAIVNAISRGKPDLGAGSTSMLEVLNAIADPGDPLTKEFERESRQQVIRWAADQIEHEFSAATWQMFWRTSVNAEPIADVAQTLKKSAGAVYVARYRVMQRLKAKVLEVSDSWSECDE